MFEKQLESLLEKKWDNDQRDLIKRLLDNLMYYKKLLPKSLKQDIFLALEMCNTLKTELEIYRELCKCACQEESNEENKLENPNEIVEEHTNKENK
jgi:hypothetical protein